MQLLSTPARLTAPTYTAERLELNIEGLHASSEEKLLRTVLGVHSSDPSALPRGLLPAVRARSRGIPFLVKELALGLLRTRQLVVRDGVCELASRDAFQTNSAATSTSEGPVPAPGPQRDAPPPLKRKVSGSRQKAKNQPHVRKEKGRAERGEKVGRSEKCERSERGEKSRAAPRNTADDRGMDVGSARARGAEMALEMPESIMAMALARVSDLPADALLTAKVAALIGPSFELRTLDAIHPLRCEAGADAPTDCYCWGPDSLESCCKVLVRQGVLRLPHATAANSLPMHTSSAAGVGSGAQYQFVSEVVREGLYGALPFAQRVTLHGALAAHLRDASLDGSTLARSARWPRRQLFIRWQERHRNFQLAGLKRAVRAVASRCTRILRWQQQPFASRARKRFGEPMAKWRKLLIRAAVGAAAPPSQPWYARAVGRHLVVRKRAGRHHAPKFVRPMARRRRPMASAADLLPPHPPQPAKLPPPPLRPMALAVRQTA